MKSKWMPFAVSGEFPKLPQLLYAGADVISDPSYFWDGAKRKRGPRCLFQYTIEGYGCFSCHGNSYKVGRGKAFIYDLNDPESCYFYPPGETRPWNFVYCVFSGFEETVEQLNAKHGPVYDFGDGNFIVAKLVAQMDSQERQNSRTSIFQSYNLCAEIIGEMCRLVELRENRGSGAFLVTKARALIHKKRLERFSLKELSSSLGVRPEHLCREFKRQLNSSPKRYHANLMAESICGRLFSGKPIKEVAQYFGFADLSNFNKFFKKRYSMTPGQFRRNSAMPLHDIFND
jgi:AraC-like DNA-binding protein